jgi:hypothetical protein
MFRCKEFVVELFTRFKHLQTNFTSSLIDMFLWMVDDQESKGGKIALWAGVLETLIGMQLTYTNTKYSIQKSNDSRASTSKQKGSSSTSKQKGSSSTSKQFSEAQQFSDAQMVLLKDYLPPFSEKRLCKDNVAVQEYIMVYQDFRVSFVIVLKGLLNILFVHVLTGNI